MRRHAFTLIELVVVVAIVVILAAILLPVFGRGSHDERRSVCHSNLRTIALGFKLYVQDWDDRFPPVAVVRSGNWAGSLQPYLKSWQIFQCPSLAKHQLKKTDYFYNARLSQVEEKTLNFYSQTILAGDGSDDSATNYALSDLPQVWRSNEKSPALRHYRNQGANYAFVDGHVKYLKPDKVNANKPERGVYTFALR